MPDLSPDDEARNRWMILQVMRLLGVGIVVLGILMARDAVDLFGDANRVVGYALVVLGLLDGFVIPRVLARKWRSPRE